MEPLKREPQLYSEPLLDPLLNLSPLERLDLGSHPESEMYQSANPPEDYLDLQEDFLPVPESHNKP